MKEKGRALRKLSLVCADQFAQGLGDIPTPPRATTKPLGIGLCKRSPALGENRRELKCTDTIKLPPIPNCIVNLRLTAQRRRIGAENAPAAWTLQSLSCKTGRGMRVRKSGTYLSRPRSRRGKVEV